MASSSSTFHRRPVFSASASSKTSSAGGPLMADVDPPPKAPRVLQIMAFGVIVLLACLQFLLPATHFRHPQDPNRNWIPYNQAAAAMAVPGRDAAAAAVVQPVIENEKIHVFSSSWEWNGTSSSSSSSPSSCLDLRVLAVLVNSTLSNTRSPENVYFHFFVPQGVDEKLSFYKMKVLLPHSNIDFVGQTQVKEKLTTLLPEWKEMSPLPLLHLLTPLIIPIIYPSFNRFIYISSDSIIKGNIRELFGIDLGLYSVATAKDCSSRLGDYVNIDVVNAIQRTAAKPWVSDEPYDRNACTLDFNLLLVDQQKMDKELLKAILWWIKALNLTDERGDKMNGVVTLALYNRYRKLPSVWKLGDSIPSKFDTEPNILRYDGPMACSRDGRQHQESDTSNIWLQYFDPKLDAILTH